MTDARTVLVVLLRVVGTAAMTAIFFVFVPFGWMQDIARWLGLSEPVATPLNQYLTRSLSAMYAIHGTALWYVSLDVVRYARLARFLSAVGIGAGVLLFGLDYLVGMPTFWTWGEGPFVALYFAAVYAAADRVCRGEGDAGDGAGSH